MKQNTEQQVAKLPELKAMFKANPEAVTGYSPSTGKFSVTFRGTEEQIRRIAELLS